MKTPTMEVGVSVEINPENITLWVTRALFMRLLTNFLRGNAQSNLCTLHQMCNQTYCIHKAFAMYT